MNTYDVALLPAVSVERAEEPASPIKKGNIYAPYSVATCYPIGRYGEMEEPSSIPCVAKGGNGGVDMDDSDDDIDGAAAPSRHGRRSPTVHDGTHSRRTRFKMTQRWGIEPLEVAIARQLAAERSDAALGNDDKAMRKVQNARDEAAGTEEEQRIESEGAVRKLSSSSSSDSSWNSATTTSSMGEEEEGDGATDDVLRESNRRPAKTQRLPASASSPYSKRRDNATRHSPVQDSSSLSPPSRRHETRKEKARAATKPAGLNAAEGGLSLDTQTTLPPAEWSALSQYERVQIINHFLRRLDKRRCLYDRDVLALHDMKEVLAVTGAAAEERFDGLCVGGSAFIGRQVLYDAMLSKVCRRFNVSTASIRNEIRFGVGKGDPLPNILLETIVPNSQDGPSCGDSSAPPSSPPSPSRSDAPRSSVSLSVSRVNKARLLWQRLYWAERCGMLHRVAALRSTAASTRRREGDKGGMQRAGEFGRFLSGSSSVSFVAKPSPTAGIELDATLMSGGTGSLESTVNAANRAPLSSSPLLPLPASHADSGGYSRRTPFSSSSARSSFLPIAMYHDACREDRIGLAMFSCLRPTVMVLVASYDSNSIAFVRDRLFNASAFDAWAARDLAFSLAMGGGRREGKGGGRVPAPPTPKPPHNSGCGADASNRGRQRASTAAAVANNMNTLTNMSQSKAVGEKTAPSGRPLSGDSIYPLDPRLAFVHEYLPHAIIEDANPYAHQHAAARRPQTASGATNMATAAASSGLQPTATKGGGGEVKAAVRGNAEVIRTAEIIFPPLKLSSGDSTSNTMAEAMQLARRKRHLVASIVVIVMDEDREEAQRVVDHLYGLCPPNVAQNSSRHVDVTCLWGGEEGLQGELATLFDVTSLPCVISVAPPDVRRCGEGKSGKVASTTAPQRRSKSKHLSSSSSITVPWRERRATVVSLSYPALSPPPSSSSSSAPTTVGGGDNCGINTSSPANHMSEHPLDHMTIPSISLALPAAGDLAFPSCASATSSVSASTAASSHWRHQLETLPNAEHHIKTLSRSVCRLMDGSVAMRIRHSTSYYSKIERHAYDAMRAEREAFTMQAGRGGGGGGGQQQSSSLNSNLLSGRGDQHQLHHHSPHHRREYPKRLKGLRNERHAAFAGHHRKGMTLVGSVFDTALLSSQQPILPSLLWAYEHRNVLGFMPSQPSNSLKDEGVAAAKGRSLSVFRSNGPLRPFIAFDDALPSDSIRGAHYTHDASALPSHRATQSIHHHHVCVACERPCEGDFRYQCLHCNVSDTLYGASYRMYADALRGKRASSYSSQGLALDSIHAAAASTATARDQRVGVPVCERCVITNRHNLSHVLLAVRREVAEGNTIAVPREGPATKEEEDEHQGGPARRDKMDVDAATTGTAPANSSSFSSAAIKAAGGGTVVAVPPHLLWGPSNVAALPTIRGVFIPSTNRCHVGVYCHKCHGAIYNVRWKCAQCYDYDLCDDCHRAMLLLPSAHHDSDATRTASHQPQRRNDGGADDGLLSDDDRLAPLNGSMAPYRPWHHDIRSHMMLRIACPTAHTRCRSGKGGGGGGGGGVYGDGGSNDYFLSEDRVLSLEEILALGDS